MTPTCCALGCPNCVPEFSDPKVYAEYLDKIEREDEQEEVENDPV